MVFPFVKNWNFNCRQVGNLNVANQLGEYYPEARWQRCIVHFYRNVFTYVPRGKIKEVAAMLKAIHAQEDSEESMRKAEAVVKKLKDMKLKRAAKVVEDGILETLTYTYSPRGTGRGSGRTILLRE